MCGDGIWLCGNMGGGEAGGSRGIGCGGVGGGGGGIGCGEVVRGGGIGCGGLGGGEEAVRGGGGIGRGELGGGGGIGCGEVAGGGKGGPGLAGGAGGGHMPSHTTLKSQLNLAACQVPSAMCSRRLEPIEPPPARFGSDAPQLAKGCTGWLAGCLVVHSFRCAALPNAAHDAGQLAQNANREVPCATPASPDGSEEPSCAHTHEPSPASPAHCS